jgi:predicted outer membrane repeat protein
MALALAIALGTLGLPLKNLQAAGIISVCDETHLAQAVQAGGTYTFSCSGTITLSAATPATGMVVASAGVTLDAAGQNVTIDGANAHRIFQIANSNDNLTLKNLTLSHGMVSGANQGGAILNNGTLTLVNVTFTNNTASGGGGAIYNTGNLNSTNSNFSNNTATGGLSGYGGAIYSQSNSSVIINGGAFNANQAATDGGAIEYTNNQTASINGTTFTSNIAGSGGAISALGGGTDSLTIFGASFNNNSASDGDGGAILNYAGPLKIYSSNFTQNTALFSNNGGGAIATIQNLSVVNTVFDTNSTNQESQGGGAILISGTGLQLDLIGCVFTKNSAGSDGGAIYNNGAIAHITSSAFSTNKANAGQGGAIYNLANMSLSTTTINNSTFNNNSAVNGGALQSDAAGSYPSVTITNSTFYANNATNTGGAIRNNGWLVTANNSTFYANSATSAGFTFYTNNYGLTVKNTIIALTDNNTNVNGCGGTFVNNGNNLQWPGNSCNSASPFIPLVDPKLQQANLTNHGGPTQTLALPAGSPAIDAGSGCPATDQRYASRNGACDIGAYELGGTVSSGPTISEAFSPASITAGGTATLTFTLHNPEPALSFTHLAFNDTLNAELQIAAVPNLQNSCSTPGTVMLSAGGGKLNVVEVGLTGGETCTIKLAVTGTKAGTYSNNTSILWTAETGTGALSNTANLTITAGAPTTVKATAGVSQSAIVNTAFGQALQATVFDTYGNPVSGVSLTFTAPGSGASAVFSNNSNVYSANTNASGVASATVTANGTTGSYNVVASAAGTTSDNFNLINVAMCDKSLVILNGDDGSGSVCGSLSYALTHVASGGVINFDANVTTINVTGSLPAPMGTNLTINATCNADAKMRGKPSVILAGQNVNGPGLTLTNDIHVQGLAITGFGGQNGFGVNITGNNNTVSCSWLGTADGVSNPKPNSGGIRIAGNNNQIGTGGVFTGNLISGNAGPGILVTSGTGNSAWGNWIGVQKDGITKLKNSGGAIKIQPGAQLILKPGNVIVS